MNTIKLSLIAIAIFSMQSFANPWKDCGVGAIIFDDNKTVAAISNIIWDWGSTAITSAISTPSACEGKKARTAMFINETYPTLEEETVKGNGKHIDSMLTMLGCDVNSHDAITESIRHDFANEITKSSHPTLSRTEKAETYYNIVDSTISNSFSGACVI